MPNRNYEKGVRWEREVIEFLEEQGYKCTRASGSHSAWDVIAWDDKRKPLFIQCKVTKDKALAKRMIEDFATTPPAPWYHKGLFVKYGRGWVNTDRVYV